MLSVSNKNLFFGVHPIHGHCGATPWKHKLVVFEEQKVVITAFWSGSLDCFNPVQRYDQQINANVRRKTNIPLYSYI